MTDHRLALDDGSLVDVLDRLLDVGAYVDGTVLLTLADIDLVRLDLRLLLASIETLRGDSDSPELPAEHESNTTAVAGRTPDASTRGAAQSGRSGKSYTSPASDVPRQRAGRPEPRQGVVVAPNLPRVHAASDLSRTDPNDTDGKDRQAGIAGLVVVLVDIVRQLLERQALRRMDAGTLTAQEVERLGRALMALEQQTAELTEFVDRHRQHESPLAEPPQEFRQLHDFGFGTTPPAATNNEGRAHR